MERSFRRSMGWLHSWAGVVLGGILFAVFWTGTLSVFDQEIDLWMKPSTRVPVIFSPVSFAIFQKSLNEAGRIHAPVWRLSLPSDRQPLARLSYREGDVFINRLVNLKTGQRLPEPETLGASGFLYPFHYSLHIRFMNIGIWCVGLAAMSMLVLCVSGVVIHRKIFSDFFTFRPGKNARRMLLDLHNLSGVLGLPFHIIFAFTGLVIFGSVYFPSGAKSVYPTLQAYFDDMSGSSFFLKPKKYDVPGVPLEIMAIQARAILGEPLGIVVVFNPGSDVARVRFIGSESHSVSGSNNTLTFDGVTGVLIGQPFELKPVMHVQRFLSGLHLIRFHHWGLRWLYFLLGLSSCLMIASGFLFWLEARRKTQGGTFGFRIVEGLTIGCVSGIILATLAFFIANRLLPAGIMCFGQPRAALEVWAFYLVWFVASLHGWFCPQRGWACQMIIIAVGAFTAVLLNWVTTGDHLLYSLMHRWLWPVAAMDMVLLAAGVVALWMSLRLSVGAGERIVRSSVEHSL